MISLIFPSAFVGVRKEPGLIFCSKSAIEEVAVLTIRNDQMGVFRRAALDSFVERMIPFLHDNFLHVTPPRRRQDRAGTGPGARLRPVTAGRSARFPEPRNGVWRGIH